VPTVLTPRFVDPAGHKAYGVTRVTPERWRLVTEVFHAALARDAARRGELLDQACVGDPALRAEVEEMLAAHRAAGGFGEGPVAAVSEATPSHIGPYRVVRELGRGGMGTVYLAERNEPGLRRSVAIKVVRRGMDSAFVVARFRTERQILASLEHPGIARLYDGGATEEGLPYFVMERVEGQDLLTYSDAHRLPIAERLRLFLQVCEAVQYAHQNLVVHRDLKPSNVLVTAKGHPKLLDFGIAKVLNPEGVEGGGEETASVVRLLTPDYASPEQARGERVTTATDVYSLGVILYELLSGHRPYRRGRAGAEIERRLAEPDIPPPSAAAVRTEKVTVRDGRGLVVIAPAEVAARRQAAPARLRRLLRGDLDNVVLKSLRVELAQRYSSAVELADDVRRHLDGFPVRARPDRGSYRLAKFLRRHRLAAGVTAIVTVALLAGFALALFGLTRARRAEAVARQEAETARHVSDFLVDLFKITEPGESRGNAVTARELLDRGALRIEDQLAAQPAVRADLLSAMGRAYGELGLFEPQVKVLEQALQADLAVYGEDSRETAATLTLLTKAQMSRGAYARGRDLARRALAIQERRLGREHLEVANTLGQLGVAHWRLGDLAAAKQSLERSLAIKEKLLGPQHRDLGGILNNVAILRWQEGDSAGARALYERALAIFEGAHDPDHPYVIRTVHNLAMVFRQTGDLQQSRALNERALASRRKILAPDHPEIAESLNDLGDTLLAAGQLQEARQAFTEALAIREKALGPDHEYVGTTLLNLGQTLTALGETTAARRHLERALALYRAALGPEHYNVGYPVAALARLDQRVGDAAAAERGYRRALELMEKGLGPRHPAVEEVRRDYVAFLRASGREVDIAGAGNP
jgi:serine/threonine-protein kinase